MKITRIEPMLIAVPYEHGGPKPMRPLGPWTHMETLFVRVDTDAGLIGWGEAFGFAASPLTREALRMVAPLCVGREVIDVPAFMTDLQRKLHAMGRHGPVSFALAGIDIALWDLVGKAQGVPLHRLLGGASRERIPTYASLLRYGNPDLVARFTQEAVGRGYAAVKLHEHLVETVAPGRKAAGPDIALMVDTNCAWTPNEAIAMARRLPTISDVFGQSLRARARLNGNLELSRRINIVRHSRRAEITTLHEVLWMRPRVPPPPPM